MEFSTEARQLTEKAFSQQEERRRSAIELRGQKADEVVENLRRQLSDLVGAKRSTELRQVIQHERLALRDLGQPPESLTRDYAQHRKMSRQKISTLIEKLGISPDKVRMIGREFHERMEEIFSPVEGKVVPGFNLQKNFDKWMSLSPLHKFPLPWGPPVPEDDPSDPHHWSLFRPPFFGFLFSFAPQTSDNFRVDHQLFLNPSVGLVGNEATMDCDDAGDFDLASATAESQIAFGFVPPVTGLVEVLIDAQCTLDRHNMKIEDEFGFSNAWCNQNSYLMMNVLHPNVPEFSLSLMSNLYQESDGDDLNTGDKENLTRGQHYFAQLFSSGPVQAGQSVVVTVGARTFDKARANDMELHSTSNFQWFINSVEVRISP
jgi:hypothetical protein